jgi:hypothetical protein
VFHVPWGERACRTGLFVKIFSCVLQVDDLIFILANHENRWNIGTFGTFPINQGLTALQHGTQTGTLEHQGLSSCSIYNQGLTELEPQPIPGCFTG